MKKRTVALLCSCALLAGIAMNSTMAWLTSTDSVTNTFTVGDIGIDLREHEYIPADKKLGTKEVYENNNYSFVPGDALPKDPFVEVEKGSENCWLFVCIKENNNKIGPKNDRERIADYAVGYSWKEITNESSVQNDSRNEDKENTRYWYCTYDSNADTDVICPILECQTVENNTEMHIKISTNVTKEMISDFKDNPPQLVFKAAAVQKDDILSKWEDAWTNIPIEFFDDDASNETP